MARFIAALSVFLVIASCIWKPDQKAEVQRGEESPVIESLQQSGLPCFSCHSYEKFSINRRGEFSHEKHVGFEIHCNHCHMIKAHKQSTIKRDACNACHKIDNFKYAAHGMPVEFSHQSHAKKYGCGECHPQTFNMKRGTTHITMDDMYQGLTCGKCHNGKVTFSSTECEKCHSMSSFKKELSYVSGGVSPAIFSHEFHAGIFSCSNCHTSVFKYRKNGSGMKMDEIYKGKYCGKCHNDEMAFGPMACKKCHK